MEAGHAGYSPVPSTVPSQCCASVCRVIAQALGDCSSAYAQPVSLPLVSPPIWKETPGWIMVYSFSKSHGRG